MSIASRKIARAILIVIFGVLALIGAIVVVAGITSRWMGLYQERAFRSVRSPDGKYEATILRSDQLFDAQTLVVIERADGRGNRQTVVAYETPTQLALSMYWQDKNTLIVRWPCEPPNLISPRYVDFVAEPSRAVVVEAGPRNPKCRYARGVNWGAG